MVTMKTNPTCRVCNTVLNSDNWASTGLKTRDYICKECRAEKDRLYREKNRDKLIAYNRLYRKENPEKVNEYNRLYRKNNPEKAKANWARARRKNGSLPMSENKECSIYFGIYIGEHDIAERVLRSIYKKVERMPMNNPDYDFICDGDKKIDVKLSCIGKSQPNWKFAIKRNTIADYFLLVVCDDRTHLNPLHIWLIPGNILNHLTGTSISQSTIHKWDEYEQDLSKAITYCDTIKGNQINVGNTKKIPSN